MPLVNVVPIAMIGPRAFRMHPPQIVSKQRRSVPKAAALREERGIAPARSTHRSELSQLWPLIASTERLRSPRELPGDAIVSGTCGAATTVFVNRLAVRCNFLGRLNRLIDA